MFVVYVVPSIIGPIPLPPYMVRVFPYDCVWSEYFCIVVLAQGSRRVLGTIQCLDVCSLYIVGFFSMWLFVDDMIIIGDHDVGIEFVKHHVDLYATFWDWRFLIILEVSFFLN